jgi:hypothetical protein
MFLSLINKPLERIEKPFSLGRKTNPAVPSLFVTFYSTVTLHACRQLCLMGQYIPRVNGMGQFVFSLPTSFLVSVLLKEKRERE